uniref:Uncharacterized protein n=1 Tax=Populus trichocarpa TaxID=3694 RepID=B9INF8_POPTR
MAFLVAQGGVLAAQVAEISVAAVEKRRLLLEVQRCSWCRRLVLSVRRKRGVTYYRDGGNLSTTVGLSLLTIVGAGARDLVSWLVCWFSRLKWGELLDEAAVKREKRDEAVSVEMWRSWSRWRRTSHNWTEGVQLSWVGCFN